MPNSPVNRLEEHWSKPAVPEAQQYGPEETSWAKSLESSIENFMADHPKLTVATAATLGLVLGWMVKRK